MKRKSIILADPPWLYGDKQGNRKGNYARMRPRDIRALNVHLLAADDAALFLWSTGPMLPTALSVMQAWQFEYRTVAFVWSKVSKAGAPRITIGHYTRPSTEFCLLGVRGRIEVQSHSVRQLVESVPEPLHSRKPAVVRERIVELLGDLPRVELFARERVEGWDAWGDEAPAIEGEHAPALAL